LRPQCLASEHPPLPPADSPFAQMAAPIAFVCGHCEALIDDNVPVYMFRDTSYCSEWCRRAGRGHVAARLAAAGTLERCRSFGALSAWSEDAFSDSDRDTECLSSASSTNSTTASPAGEAPPSEVEQAGEDAIGALAQIANLGLMLLGALVSPDAMNDLTFSPALLRAGPRLETHTDKVAVRTGRAVPSKQDLVQPGAASIACVKISSHHSHYSCPPTLRDSNARVHSWFKRQSV